MRKVHKKINADELLFHYSDTNEEEIKFLFGLYHDTNSQQKSSGMTHFLQGKYTEQQCH